MEENHEGVGAFRATSKTSSGLWFFYSATIYITISSTPHEHRLFLLTFVGDPIPETAAAELHPDVPQEPGSWAGDERAESGAGEPGHWRLWGSQWQQRHSLWGNHRHWDLDPRSQLIFARKDTRTGAEITKKKKSDFDTGFCNMALPGPLSQHPALITV